MPPALLAAAAASAAAAVNCTGGGSRDCGAAEQCCYTGYGQTACYDPAATVCCVGPGGGIPPTGSLCALTAGACCAGVCVGDGSQCCHDQYGNGHTCPSDGLCEVFGCGPPPPPVGAYCSTGGPGGAPAMRLQLDTRSGTTYNGSFSIGDPSQPSGASCGGTYQYRDEYWTAGGYVAPDDARCPAQTFGKAWEGFRGFGAYTSGGWPGDMTLLFNDVSPYNVTLHGPSSSC